MLKADMVNPSSSGTEEALDLLFLGSADGCHSPASNIRMDSDSIVFEDWPEVNDDLGSCASTVDALCDV
jgi:hypothetical protein